MGSSVIGIDLGTLTSYVAGIRSGAVHVILDETSSRSICSAVSLRGKSRHCGVQAEPMITSNYRNTVTHLKPLLGLPFAHPKAQDIASRLSCAVVPSPEGGVAFQLSFDGEELTLSATQVVAMLLQKLRLTAECSLGSRVTDAVISVPSFFTDGQRRALIDAASLAGLNCFKLISDLASAAVNYGYYKKNLAEGVVVAIVDFGHSSLQVGICRFKDGSAQVVGAAFDDEIGGDRLDMLLMEHFCRLIAAKYNLRVEPRSKPFVKLREATRKVKKSLSVNTNKQFISLEAFMEDVDVHVGVTREEFEEMARGVMARAGEVMQTALERAGVEKEKIEAVEVVGGSSRVPLFVEAVEGVFGRRASRTMNADEAVARGCAIQAAILSANLRASPYSVMDYLLFDLVVSCRPEREAELLRLPVGTGLPVGRRLTLLTEEKTTLVVAVAGETVEFGLAEAGEVEFKLIVDKSGLVRVTSAAVVERFTEEVEEKEGEEVVKKTVGKRRLREVGVLCAGRRGLEAMVEVEARIAAVVSREEERNRLRNAIEESIFRFRGDLDRLGRYVPPGQQFGGMLNEMEMWLYEEEGSLGECRERLARIEGSYGPILRREEEYRVLPHVLEEVGEQLRRVAEKGGEDGGVGQWYQAVSARWGTVPLYEDSPVTVAEVREKLKVLADVLVALSTPKTEVPDVPAEESMTVEGNGEESMTVEGNGEESVTVEGNGAAEVTVEGNGVKDEKGDMDVE